MIIVAGVTRSGLSLTMQMLWAGGYPCVGSPPAFEEYIIGETPWGELGDVAVKLVDSHRHFPPRGILADVILLHRSPIQTAKSINKWNGATMGLPPIETGRLVTSIRRDLKMIKQWTSIRRTLHLNFERLVEDPLKTAKSIMDWSRRGGLDAGKMAECVLHRQPECYPFILENLLIQMYNNLDMCGRFASFSERSPMVSKS